MEGIGIIEERVSFSAAGNRLSGILSYPEEQEPCAAVLLCSPHPHFAGDMDNNVVRAMAQGLGQRAVCLRFDYRGVCDSTISLPTGLGVFDYWSEVEENRDYDDAVADVTGAADALTQMAGAGLDLLVVGYSFGTATGARFAVESGRARALAAIAPPLGRVSFDFMQGCPVPNCWLMGRNDFLYDDQHLLELRQCVTPNGRVEVLDDTDHFYRGDEDRVALWVEKELLD
jgi:alpha/beta superfamily hydrolase